MGSPVDARRARWRLLTEIDRLARWPLVGLSFVWLGLLVLDLLGRSSATLETLALAIWAVFIAQFVIEVTIAPDRPAYLRRHWLTAISLVLPALRIVRAVPALRVLRATRAVRSLSLLRVVTSVTRGLGALRVALVRRGFAYVVGATVLIAALGAAAMLAFEGQAALLASGDAAGAGPGGGLRDYGDALWQTVMLLVTMGPAQPVVTPEGRIVAFLVALYGFAIFGYITAMVATWFLGRTPATGPEATDVPKLRQEIAALRRELRALHGGAGAASDASPDGTAR